MPGEGGGPRDGGEIAVGGAEASNEVVFEGSDRAFGGIAAVDVWWYELEVYLLLGHVGFEGG